MSLHANVLVALSGDDSDAELLRYAQTLSRQGLVARWDFVHVSDGQLPAGPRRRLLQQRVDAFFGATPPTGDRLHVLDGALIDRLLSLAAESQADLLLLGASNASRRSLARRLAMKAPCSIWMVPRESPPMLRRILVPIDLSPCSAEALRAGAALAAVSGGECLALYVQEDPTESFEEGDLSLERGSLAEFLDEAGVRAEAIVETNAEVPAAILRHAQSRQPPDLIIMGARGCSRSRSILLGSEVEAVLAATPAPLLVVKANRRIEVLAALLEHVH
jgi:nucleotide-binding universal stress UspA family protein